MSDSMDAFAPELRESYAGWFILDVLRRGDPERPFRRGRPKNVWVALLIDTDPEIYCAGLSGDKHTKCVVLN